MKQLIITMGLIGLLLCGVGTVSGEEHCRDSIQFGGLNRGAHLFYPGKDTENKDYMLVIYKNYFKIWGHGLLAIQDKHCKPGPPPNCDPPFDTLWYVEAGPAKDAIEMATINAWIARLLHAQATNQPVRVFYALDTVGGEEVGECYGTGNGGRGSITGIGEWRETGDL